MDLSENMSLKINLVSLLYNTMVLVVSKGFTELVGSVIGFVY